MLRKNFPARKNVRRKSALNRRISNLLKAPEAKRKAILSEIEMLKKVITE